MYLLKCLYKARNVRRHVFVKVVSILLISVIFSFDFGTVPTGRYYWCFVWFWNCFDRAVLLVFRLILEVFRQGGIIGISFDFGTVPTGRYFWYFVWFWNCSDRAILLVFRLILELFRQGGIIGISFDFGTVPTGRYYLYFIWYSICYLQLGPRVHDIPSKMLLLLDETLTNKGQAWTHDFMLRRGRRRIM
jgi:hypothetical protein